MSILNPKIKTKPILNIQGQQIGLGPMSKKYLELYTEWINDFETTSYLSKFVKPTTEESELEWYDNIGKSSDSINFTVYDLKSLKPIGTVALFKIDHIHKTAEMGIMLGDKNYWSKGYGTETVQLIVDYGFTCLALNNILLRVYSYNPRAIKTYQKAGFKIVGTWREAHRIAGKFYDVVVMDYLSKDFTKSHIIKSLPEGIQ